MVGRYLGGSISSHRAVSTPCDELLARHVQDAATNRPKAAPELLQSYQSLVGALMYAASATRPDVAFAVGMLARAMTFPTQELWQDATRVLVYLAGHREGGISFPIGADGVDGRPGPLAQPQLSGLSDSDWSVRVSTTGICIFFGEAIVAWVSKRQACIALSSCEAEIMAASTAAIELVFMRNVLEELRLPADDATRLGVDNSGAVDIAHDPMHRGRTMHIERRHLKVRELVSRGIIDVYKEPGETNIADIFTKPINPKRFRQLRDRIMVGCHKAEAIPIAVKVLEPTRRARGGVKSAR